MLPEVSFQDGNPLLLTTEGEFVLTNVVLIAGAVMLGAWSSHVRTLRDRCPSGPTRDVGRPDSREDGAVSGVGGAFELYEGAADSPVLLHGPHAGTDVPGWTRPHLLLDDAELADEIAALTDHRTGEIALAAAERAQTRPWVLVNSVSRFVVDPERFPDDREEMAAAGMAAVYTRGTRGQRLRADDPAHRDALLAAFYAPWAAAVEHVVAARLEATGTAVLLDVHSYPSGPLPYELHGAGPRAPVCLGVDARHTPAWLVDAAREVFAPVGDVGANSPFAGAYVPLSRYGTDARVHALMLELRRDTHIVEPDGPPTPGFAGVVEALASLVGMVGRAAG